MKKLKSLWKNLSKIKKVLLAVLSLVVFILVLAGVLLSGTPVETAEVSQGPVSEVVKEAGTVESESALILTAKQTGEIRGLLVEEGDSVSAGDLLLTGEGSSASLDVKSQQAQLRALKSQYTLAQDAANKSRLLYEQGAVSQQEYNQAQATANQLAAQVDALAYSIESYASSSGTAGLTAPIGGVITGIFAKEGETILASAPILEISNLDDIYVVCDLIASDADLVTPGDPVLLTSQEGNYEDSSAQVRKVHIKAQDQLSDLGIQQKRVRVEIDLGQEKAPRLGSTIDVEITIDQHPEATRVPKTAVYERDQQSFVFVVEGRKAVEREVMVGLKGRDFTEIITGLTPGESVILSPDNQLSNGTFVKATDVTHKFSSLPASP